MSIVNRRNALIGWATWSVGKNLAKYHQAKRKAQAVVPSRSGGGSKGKKKAVKVMAVVAAAGGALVFWKAKTRGGGEKDVFGAEEPGAAEEVRGTDE
jgi:hypothetical protein